MTDTPTSSPAHRPSRRNEVLDAAIVLFAQRGFADAAINDVAEASNVAVTSIYYHFSGKDELYSEAVRRVFESISACAEGANADTEEHSLDRVIDAVWEWIDNNPNHALLYSQLPGATRQVSQLRREFEDQHVQGAVHYLSGSQGTGRNKKAQQAVDTLTTRTLIDVLISVQTMRVADGPLSEDSSDDLRRSVKQLASRLVTAN